jgi:hypothetical protein
MPKEANPSAFLCILARSVRIERHPAQRSESLCLKSKNGLILGRSLP